MFVQIPRAVCKLSANLVRNCSQKIGDKSKGNPLDILRGQKCKPTDFYPEFRKTKYYEEIPKCQPIRVTPTLLAKVNGDRLFWDAFVKDRLEVTKYARPDYNYEVDSFDRVATESTCHATGTLHSIRDQYQNFSCMFFIRKSVEECKAVMSANRILRLSERFGSSKKPVDPYESHQTNAFELLRGCKTKAGHTGDNSTGKKKEECGRPKDDRIEILPPGKPGERCPFYEVKLNHKPLPSKYLKPSLQCPIPKPVPKPRVCTAPPPPAPNSPPPPTSPPSCIPPRPPSNPPCAPTPPCDTPPTRSAPDPNKTNACQKPNCAKQACPKPRPPPSYNPPLGPPPPCSPPPPACSPPPPPTCSPPPPACSPPPPPACCPPPPKCPCPPPCPPPPTFPPPTCPPPTCPPPPSCPPPETQPCTRGPPTSPPKPGKIASSDKKKPQPSAPQCPSPPYFPPDDGAPPPPCNCPPTCPCRTQDSSE